MQIENGDFVCFWGDHNDSEAEGGDRADGRVDRGEGLKMDPEQEIKSTSIIIPIVKVGTLFIFTIGMIFFITPWLMDKMQSDSNMCGKEYNSKVTYISSLESDKNAEGSFFLGIGSIRTERVYVAYTGDNQIGYRLIERPVAQSLLFEDTNQSPYIEEVSVLLCNAYGYSQTTWYKFHVPVGTIKMEYAV